MARSSLLRPIMALASGVPGTEAARLGTTARGRFGNAGRWALLPAALLLALGIGGLSTLSLRMTLGGCFVLLLMAGVWARPALAAYLLIALTPLTAGIDRGRLTPVVRPSEALALLVGSALAARALVGWRTGWLPTVRLNRVEASMLLMAVTSSAVPLLWMLARQRQITPEDILYTFVMWKYLILYAIVRLSVVSDRQVRRCLWLSVGAAGIVAAVAILQSLGLFGVPRLLATFYAPFGHTGAVQNARGSSTLALAAATGDLLIYNLAIVTGLAIRDRRNRVAAVAAAMLFIVGTLSAGEFSTAIGLAVGVLCIVTVTRSVRLLTLFVLAASLGAQLLRPVIDRRLTGFQSASGLPVSWTGRLHNLQTYFWPKLFSDWNFLFGVRPSARVSVASQATGYVWIESGYTWLLWGGGIPLFASFFLFVHAALKAAWQAAHRREDAASIAGLAAFTAVTVTTVLMLFDPHLTYRGSADALFFLLALAAPRGVRGDADDEGGPLRGPRTPEMRAPWPFLIRAEEPVRAKEVGL